VYRLVSNLDAEDLRTWEAEEVLRSEDSANPPQLSSTILPFPLHQLVEKADRDAYDCSFSNELLFLSEASTQR
jgi:hypothetical protein